MPVGKLDLFRNERIPLEYERCTWSSFAALRCYEAPGDLRVELENA